MATVSSAGKITAKAVGDATITCITANGLREDCEVTVTPTMVSNLSLNQDQLQMSIGDTYQFSTAVAPESATYQQVTWKSMNPDVVSVDNNGLIATASPSLMRRPRPIGKACISFCQSAITPLPRG